MKVFISWSGLVSHKVAIVFRDWLPSVIQNIEPYVSSEDIDKGARWSTDIAGELHASTYGIICLTQENVKAPWINFEAGALGKSIDKSRVSPFLFGLKRSEVDGPILQFQSTVLEQEDVFKLIKSINTACGSDGLEISRLEKSFNVWWPQLKNSLDEIEEPSIAPTSSTQESSPTQFDSMAKVMEEILELSRNNHKLLRDPAALLPPEHLKLLLNRPNREGNDFTVRGHETTIHPEAIRETIEFHRNLLKFLETSGLLSDRGSEIEELYSLLRIMDDPIRYMARKMGSRLPRFPARETQLVAEAFLSN